MPRMYLVAIPRTIELMKAIFPLILPVIFLGLLLGRLLRGFLLPVERENRPLEHRRAEANPNRIQSMNTTQQPDSPIEPASRHCDPVCFQRSQYYSSPCRQLSTPANHKLADFIQSTRSAIAQILRLFAHRINKSRWKAGRNCMNRCDPVVKHVIRIILLEDNPEFTIACFTGYYKNQHTDLARFMQRS